MDKNKVRVRFIIYTLKVKLCPERGFRNQI